MTESIQHSIQQRIKTFQSSLSFSEACLLSTANDIHYFSQFEFLLPEEREAFLLITAKETYLIASSFSPVPNLDFLHILRGTHSPSLAQHLEKIVSDVQIKTLFYQSTSLFVE